MRRVIEWCREEGLTWRHVQVAGFLVAGLVAPAVIDGFWGAVASGVCFACVSWWAFRYWS